MKLAPAAARRCERLQQGAAGQGGRGGAAPATGGAIGTKLRDSPGERAREIGAKLRLRAAQTVHTVERGNPTDAAQLVPAVGRVLRTRQPTSRAPTRRPPSIRGRIHLTTSTATRTPPARPSLVQEYLQVA